MAKKKEDLGGVWRTVGGRRIFIKDGQDLYEAMNDSGKFTNLKRTNKARQGVKEIDYIGQDGKKHKMNSYDYPEDRDEYHKYLTEKYGTYKEEEIKDKYGRTDYKKLREEFYQHQEKASYKIDGKTISEQDLRKEFDKELERGNIEKGTTYNEWKKGIVDDRNSNVKSEWQDIPGFKDFEYNQEKDEVRLKSEFGYIDKRNKEIEFERNKGIYTGARETNPDGSYKHQEEFEKWKEENNEKIASYYSTTYSKDLKNINKDVWNSIAKDIYDEEKMPEKINKQDQLLAKASKIEEIEAELKQVQSRVWNAENDMADEGIEENRWRENPSYNEDRYRLVYLRRDLEEAKDEYWKEKNKINQKRWEKELNSKPKVDDHDLDKLREIADNYEDESKYDLDDIQKDYIKNRRNEMSFNKRNDEFIKNHTPKQKEFPLLKKHGLDKDEKFRYMMLSRMQSDADYYLGNGNKNAKNLWAKDEEEHIGLMKELYDSVSEKPDWLSQEQLNKYEKELSYEKYKRNSIYTDKNGAKIGHSMVVQYATMNHLTIEEAKRILGVK